MDILDAVKKSQPTTTTGVVPAPSNPPEPHPVPANPAVGTITNKANITPPTPMVAPQSNTPPLAQDKSKQESLDFINSLINSPKKQSSDSVPLAPPNIPSTQPTIDTSTKKSFDKTSEPSTQTKTIAIPPALDTKKTITTPSTTPSAGVVIPPPPSSKRKFNPMIAITAAVILLVTLPLGAYFVQKQTQLADNRSRAASSCACDPNFPEPNCVGEHKNGNCWYVCDVAKKSWGDPVRCENTSQPTSAPTQKCPSGNQGQPGETCGNLDMCDIAGGCNKACGVGTRGEEICDVPNGYCVKGFSCRAASVGYHLKCVSNACVNQTCDNGAASCANECTTNQECQPVANPTPTTTCAGATQSCEGITCCSGQNLVCQGIVGSRVCQQTGTGGSGNPFCQAGGAGSTCNGYRGHKCSYLSDGQCLENGQTFSSRAEAETYSQGCGQIDIVCVGGTRAGQLCGDFTIYNSSCGQKPQPTTPPPSATPIIGQCDAMRIYLVQNGSDVDVTDGLKNGSRKLRRGDQIKMVVDGGANAKAARFRIQGLFDFPTNGQASTLSKYGSSATQYIQSYTIPQTLTQQTLTIESEVYIAGSCNASGSTITCGGGSWK